MHLTRKSVQLCVLIFAFACMFPIVSFAKKPAGDKYISQELIDTSILRAFVILNASADMGGVGFGHQRSLTEAKKIAQELKTRAKGDPNERYVLWKVSELEAQIYLEERDMVLQQMQKRQLTINELVDKYNVEVGKWRPDFGTLYRLHKSMDQVDPGKAGELADSYNKRKRGISREIVYFIEKALLAGNIDEARKETGYCLRNQMYLDVSTSTYKNLEDRVEGLYDAIEKKPLVVTGTRSAQRHLDRVDIVEARKTIDTVKNILSTIKKHLPQSEVSVLASSLKRVETRLSGIEDSLVNVNVRILKTEGVEAADRYLQAVLRSYGVSRDKAAYVDRMIISVKSPDESASPAALSGLDVDSEEEVNPALDDVLAKARRKAQVKMDSLQKIEDARLWKDRQEQARRDSIDAVRRAVEEASLQKQLQRVDSISMAAYALIEKGMIPAAEKLLIKEKSFLDKYMRQEDLSLLRTTILQFTSYMGAEKTEITYLKPSAQPAAAPVATPVPQNGSSNQDRAQAEILGIYSLLEQNEIDRAYKRFQSNKSPLRKYLEPEVYSMLEMTVVQAYEYQSLQIK